MATPSVTIYTTSSCPYCAMAKACFTKHKVLFKEINVEADESAAAQMIEKSGQMGVPVLDIGGTIIVGFDKDAIAKALGIPCA